MKWNILPKKSDDLFEQLLINRGIIKEKKDQFLNPKLEEYEKDLNIPGIKKAQQRVAEAIKDNELIIVYGDYDVDGITSCAILYKALVSIGAKVLPYIPHREKEGYGLSKLGLEVAKDSGAALVISVDCGIVAFEQAKHAKSLGLDLIITDHHVTHDKLPEAFGIIHSTKMCGAAVAWCLVRNIIKKDLQEELLQFVAIATVCDLIPLVDLGRAFVFEGLKVLNNTVNPGLLALFDEAGIQVGSIGSYEIGYIIGPRLNAIGRLDHAIDALRLFCTKDQSKARKLASLLGTTNTTRQEMTMVAVEQATIMVESEEKIQVLHSKEWSSGIIGLIAGKITEQYYQPSIAISMGDKISKGSARSIDGINIVELIRKYQDILIDVGGHPGAAGFSIETKHISIFKKRIQEHVQSLPKPGEKVLQIDAEVATKQLNKNLVQALQKFEPFGFKNPKPTFASKNVKVSDIRTVGSERHLKFKIDNIDAIAFGMGKLATILFAGQIIDVAFNLEINEYNGTEKLQLKVKDIKLNS